MGRPALRPGRVGGGRHDGTQGGGADGLERIAEHVEKVAGQVRWLAFQLREAGVAEQGLGFAISTLGSERVKAEVEQGPPFGVRCRGRAAFASDPDETAAWTILSACAPGVVSRRLGGPAEGSGTPRRRRRGRGRSRREVARPAA